MGATGREAENYLDMKFQPSKKAPCSAELRRELDSIWRCINERKLKPADGQSFSQYSNGFTFAQKRKISPAGAAERVFLQSYKPVESAHVISLEKNLSSKFYSDTPSSLIPNGRTLGSYYGVNHNFQGPFDSGHVEGHPWLLVSTKPAAYEALGSLGPTWGWNDLSRRGITRAWLPPMSREHFSDQMFKAGGMRIVALATTVDVLNNLEYSSNNFGAISGNKVSHGKLPEVSAQGVYYGNQHHEKHSVGTTKGQWNYAYWNTSNPLRTIDFDSRGACTQVPIFTPDGSNLDYIAGPHAIGLSGDFWEFVKQ